MTSSLHLQIPFIEPAQAQKHITHNEALLLLDAIVQLSVVSVDLTMPPDTAGEGARYIVASEASGAWVGQETKIALMRDGDWSFIAPQTGWRVWVEEKSGLSVWDGSDWSEIISQTPQFERLGVGASADSVNKLSLNSAASLFNHDGLGHQIKINKSATGETAAVLYQTGFSGRAEMGLTGSDDFTIKTSMDGQSYSEKVRINNASGNIQLFASGGGEVELGNYSIGQSPRLIVKADKTHQARAYVSLRHDNDEGGVFYTQYDSTADEADFIVRCLGRGRDIRFLTRDGSGQTQNQLTLNGGSGNIGVGLNSPQSRLDVDGAVRVKSYSVSALPSASTYGAGAMIYVTDAASGSELCVSDGTDWRQATTRQVVV